MTLGLNIGNNPLGAIMGGRVNGLTNMANNPVTSVVSSLNSPQGFFGAIEALDKATKVSVDTPLGSTAFSAMPGMGMLSGAAKTANSISSGNIGDAVVSGIKSFASMATMGLSDVALGLVGNVVGKETSNAQSKGDSGVLGSIAEGLSSAVGAIGDAVASVGEAIGEALGLSDKTSTETATAEQQAEATAETATADQSADAEASSADNDSKGKDNDSDSGSSDGDSGGSDGGGE